jgi:hypothetical protein
MRTLPLTKRITVSARRVLCDRDGLLGDRWSTEIHRPCHARIPRPPQDYESEWGAFCKDFDDTMAKFNVPEAEHKELFGIVQSTKGDIVTG